MQTVTDAGGQGRRPWRDWRACLAGVLLLSLALRLFGLDWDERRLLHPDERFIATVAHDTRWPSSVGGYFDTGRSPLNPANLEPPATYSYGTLPLFTVKAVAGVAGVDDFGERVLVGRVLGALLDTGTVLLVFLCGALVVGRRTGLLAALLAALAVLPIQLAHFWTVDPWLGFFAAATLLVSLLALRDGRRRWLIAGGAATGAAFACKAPGLLLAAVPVTAALLRVGASQVPWPGAGATARRPDDWRQSLVGLLAGALALVAVARVAQPYAFAGPSIWDLALNRDFIDALAEQRELLGGGAAWPPALPWADRPRLLYPLQNLLGWGLGPALGLAAAAATGFAVWRARREAWLAVPLVAAGAFLVVHGLGFVAYTRYFLPTVAPLCLLTAWLLLGGEREGRRTRRAAVAVAVATGLWALAFTSIYDARHTRIEASEWIHDNVPAQASLAVEEWDDELPVQLAGRPARPPALRLPVVEPESEEKALKILDVIARSDYVVVSSDRLRDPITRLPAAFPATSRYYAALEDGSLGFRRVARFERGPALLGVGLPSWGAEESFAVYDHPTVRIYAKTAGFSHARAREMLLATDPDGAVTGPPRVLGIEPPLQAPGEAAAQRAGGTWREILPVRAGSAAGAAALWLLALELFALVVLPALMWALRRLPGRGVGLAKPLGLLLVAYPVWLGASIGAWSFTRWSVLVCFAVMAAGAAAAAWRFRGRLVAVLREHRSGLLAAEAVFLGTFLAVYALRTGNPDLFHPFRGGEKPMDFAHLNAIVKSTQMPPYDPWFAGGYLNYYYLGAFLMAVPTKALGIAPELAYNLAVPTLAAFAASAAYALGHDLAALSPRRGGARTPILAGLAAVLLVLVAGNLDGAVQWIERVQTVDRWDFLEGTSVLGGLASFAGGLWSLAFSGAQLAPFDYWGPSRVIADSFAVTEFPAFTVLLGDLHAHLAALPYAAATAAAAVCAFAAAAAGDGLRRSLPALVLCGFLIGALKATNTWDVPTQALGAVIAIGAGVWLSRKATGGPWLWAAVLRVGVVSAVAWLAFRPFDAHFRTYYTDLAIPEDTTPPVDLAVQFGLPMLLVAGLVAAGPGSLRSVAHPGVVAAAGAATVAAALAGRATLAIVVVLASLVAGRAVASARVSEDRGILAALGLAFLGLVAIAVAEVVRVEQDLERMNTVFKLWFGAWWLLAVPAAYSAWRLLERRPRSWPGRAWTVAVAVLAAGAIVYPLNAVPARLDDRFADLPATADGMAYMRHAVYSDDRGAYRLSRDLAAIRWVRANVKGSPVIMEAVTPLYRWGSRFSVHTGLPAVLGWDFHQKQQRGGSHAEVDRRAREVTAFYSTTDFQEALVILRRHDVRYVVVGELERAYYPADGIAKVGLLPGLSLAFENDGVQIYERAAGS